MASSTITEQLMHLGRIASGDGLVEGLTPGQWAILRYFSYANRFSQTPSAFAAFHGTTRYPRPRTVSMWSAPIFERSL